MERIRRTPFGYQVSASPRYLARTGSPRQRLLTRTIQDPQGVGPPQYWFVQGGTTIPFHFEFGVKGEYGAPNGP